MGCGTSVVLDASPYGPIEAPEAVMVERHPVSYYNGLYILDPFFVNGRPHFVRATKASDSDDIPPRVHLYYYDRAEGGCNGWSFDHRVDKNPHGLKDWCSGGWLYPDDLGHSMEYPDGSAPRGDKDLKLRHGDGSENIMDQTWTTMLTIRWTTNANIEKDTQEYFEPPNASIPVAKLV